MRYRITDLVNQSRKYWEAIFWAESTDFNELLTVCQGYDYYWIGPLHQPDNDCNKPHFHVIVGADRRFCPYRKRSKYSAIINVPGATWSKELDKGIAFPVDRLESSLAYLIHLNNPEKQQFDGGFNEVITNCRWMLDGIVKREPAFNCFTWDDKHKPYSLMDALRIISDEGFLTPTEVAKLVSWYVSHMDIFDGRERLEKLPEGIKPGQFYEVDL